MKVYRLYVKGECVGTYGEGDAAHTMAMAEKIKWIEAGYLLSEIEIRHEGY